MGKAGDIESPIFLDGGGSLSIISKQTAGMGIWNDSDLKPYQEKLIGVGGGAPVEHQLVLPITLFGYSGKKLQFMGQFL
jgi:hypothetical protein